MQPARSPLMQGRDLLREPRADWDATVGSALALNPRLDTAWRERVLAADFPDLPDHVWVATSGTSGRLKIVALSVGALEASAAAVNRHLCVQPSDCWLNPLPLFHVGGLGITVRVIPA